MPPSRPPVGGGAAHRIPGSSTPPPSPSRYYAKALFCIIEGRRNCSQPRISANTGIRLGGFHHLRDNFRFLLVFLPLTNTRISGTIELRRTGKPFKRQSTPSCLERGILFNGCRHFTTAEPPFSRGFFYWCSFFTTFSAISSANSSISAELAQALETLPPVIISEKAYNIVVESLSC